MLIEQHVALAPLTTLRIGGAARWFARAASVEEVLAAVRFARERGLPLFALGGGSNVLMPDAGFAGLVLHMAIAPSIAVEGAVVRASAGTDWDMLVRFCCERGLAGMECLAGIPGMVGAAPIQNIGAYGQEAAQTILAVEAIDLAGEPHIVALDREVCGFGYRSSVFNGRARGRYLVTAVRFQMMPGGAPNLGYADLATLRDSSPSLPAVYEFVRRTRDRKGMLIDPQHLHADSFSAGSFFKNPVVDAAHVAGLEREQGRAIPHWPTPDGHVKLPAAWLIEQAGFPKGYVEREGSPVGLSTRHTLALVNRSGHATCAELLGLRDRIVQGVRERFGVVLEQEPVMP